MAASTTYLAPAVTLHLVVCPKCREGHMPVQAKKETECVCGHCQSPWVLYWEGFTAAVRLREAGTAEAPNRTSL